MFENKEAVVNDFEQAWGEAMHLFKNADENPVLVLPKDLQKLTLKTCKLLLWKRM